MSTVSVVASSVDSPGVSAELVDAVVEAVMLSPDPHARSTVLYSLVNEMCAAVASVHADESTLTADVELTSVGRLAAAARDHLWRMAYLQISSGESDAR